MKDIAERAGVSPSAVSFALNDRDGVSPGTRARIREVAEELGWQPNSAARALSGERSGCVGLVLARPAHTLGVESFFLQLVSGIQEALAAQRVALLFQVVEDLEAECAIYRRWWAERRVDGVLVVDPRAEDPRPALLASLALPTVVIGDTSTPSAPPPTSPSTRPSPSTPLSSPTPSPPSASPSVSPSPPGPPPPPPAPLSTIWADDAAAMRSIIDHLYALGHRRIVHIAGLPGLAHTERRVAALRAEAARLGLDAAEVRSVSTDYSDEQGAEATHRLLAAPRPPTAIVYDNDVMAVAGAAVAAGRGVPVPAALSIVAWDDSPLCRVTHPRLTSLVRDTAGFGRLAAQELLSLLDGAPTRRLQAELPHLELRESTAPAP
ncbi:LacI family transcriptional regulator [Streptomyces albofaciens JCM 4342]|uniref:LacI family DNA-binding transcriptional regulator n=1 Tax=Streptomyces albofaciens TaxID=66866 RepID=UPI00123AAF65|nr:LacI family DNA-binding transcriptional regulator [Streptomyces albofaciens]KAA6221355.1 LacI family transcriptional regulator [Streptomyces albofaciens JCM 4342]